MNGIWTMGLAEDKKGLSGSTIKLIAVLTMIIDHTGAVILGRYLAQAGIQKIASQQAFQVWLAQNHTLYYAYRTMRSIGRIAFPIYCFLLVEGFFRSRNRKKYCLRLLLFAALSEIPFNLALNSTLWYPAYQNVFMELAMGLLAMMGIQALCERIGGKFLRIIALTGITAAAAAAAEWLSLDYGAIGIVCIVLLYLYASDKKWQLIVGALSFLWETTAPLAFIPIAFYNGKRGLKLKYFFYLVYPVHLLLLYFLCVVLGISGYTAL